MNAAEARNRTIDGQGGMQYIFKAISDACKQGNNKCPIMAMSKEQADYLSNQNFSVHYDDIFQIWTVSW